MNDQEGHRLQVSQITLPGGPGLNGVVFSGGTEANENHTDS